MSFNIYFAGNHANATDDFFMKRQANRLFNQLFERKSIGEKYLRHKLEVPDTKAKLFVDSSAFSAHTLGSEVDIDSYIEYVNANQGMFDCIAELDKIPGEFRKPKTREQLLEAPEISWNNYLYMRDRVIDNDKLLPIFHMGEDFKWLELMLETTFDGSIFLILEFHLQMILFLSTKTDGSNTFSTLFEKVQILMSRRTHLE